VITLNRRIDSRLVNPNAAGVFSLAGAAAKHDRANQQAEEVAQDEYLDK
jgi:hypothetical protein